METETNAFEYIITGRSHHPIHIIIYEYLDISVYSILCICIFIRINVCGC